MSASNNNKSVDRQHQDFASLKNIEKVRLFWKCTNLPQDEFRAMICRKLQKEDLEVFNDFTETLLYDLMHDLVKRALDMHPQCGKVAAANHQKFIDNPRSKEIVRNFVITLSNFYHDEPLALSLLLNFIRSVLRNDFIRKNSKVDDVDLQQGITERIWTNAYRKYFPEDLEA